MTFYTVGVFDRRVQDYQSSEAGTFLDVPATNPYNPFGEDVFVAYLFGNNETGPLRYEYDTTNIQGSVGVRGDIGPFNYDVAYSAYRQEIFETVITDIDVPATEAAAARTDATAFNPFCNNCNTAAQLEGFAPSGFSKDVNTLRTLDAKITGDLFDWYAGPVAFALGGERRWVKFRFTDGYNDVDYFESGRGGGGDDRGERTVSAVFGEVRIPLYGEEQAGGFLNSAEVTGATRYENYSDFGSSTVGSVSALAGFFEDNLLARFTYSKSFRAPEVSALNFPITTETLSTNGFFFDPVRGDILPFDLIFGGNPDLEPEKGRSINAGIVLQTPERNLRFSVDYFDLQISKLIREPDIQALLDGVSAGGAITRDPDTLYPTVDIRLDNLGTRAVTGLDFGVTYNKETDRFGDFFVDFNGTLLTTFEDEIGGEVFDFLGTYDQGAIGTIPEFRGLIQSGWSKDGYSAVATFNYTSSYRESSSNTAERRSGSYQTVNLFFSKDFEADDVAFAPSLFEGLQIYAGIDNIFNKAPNFIAASSDGYDRLVADIRGRYIFGGVRKQF
ncbi:MAG: TonB-dependent receptor [Pseudomonadota bacterium]